MMYVCKIENWDVEDVDQLQELEAQQGPMGRRREVPSEGPGVFELRYETSDEAVSAQDALAVVASEYGWTLSVGQEEAE